MAGKFLNRGEIFILVYQQNFQAVLKDSETKHINVEKPLKILVTSKNKTRSFLQLMQEVIFIKVTLVFKVGEYHRFSIVIQTVTEARARVSV